MTKRIPCRELPANQRGLTMISWIVVIAFLAFQVVIALNVVPVYIADNSVQSVMKALEDDNEIRKSNSKQIKALLLKRFKLNNVYNIKAENITVKKTKSGTRVILKYEPRGTLIGSLDYIVSFKHEATIPR